MPRAELVELKNLIKAGKLQILSLDTSIIQQLGYRFENGLLGHLRQFKDTGIDVVLSDVVYREVTSHLQDDGKKIVKNFQDALAHAGKFWKRSESRKAEVEALLTGGITPDEVIQKRLKSFSSAVGLEVISSQHVGDMEKLLNMYFGRQAPFEANERKKAEFPDAIALLSMEGYANSRNLSLLAISKDAGWRKFSEKSNRIYCLEDLGVALSLFHDLPDVMIERVRLQLVGPVATALQSKISNKIVEFSNSGEFSLEGESEGPYDDDLYDIQITLLSWDQALELRIIDSNENKVVFECSLDAQMKAYYAINPEFRDPIDRDVISLGWRRFNVEFSTTFEIIIAIDPETLATFENEELDVEGVEIEVSCNDTTIDIGFVDTSFISYDQEDDD